MRAREIRLSINRARPLLLAPAMKGALVVVAAFIHLLFEASFDLIVSSRARARSESIDPAIKKNPPPYRDSGCRIT